MIRYYIIAALVFAAIVTVEGCLPFAAGCIAIAGVLTYVKTSRTN